VDKILEKNKKFKGKLLSIKPKYQFSRNKLASRKKPKTHG
jgi:hypothetical protein